MKNRERSREIYRTRDDLYGYRFKSEKYENEDYRRDESRERYRRDESREHYRRDESRERYRRDESREHYRRDASRGYERKGYQSDPHIRDNPLTSHYKTHSMSHTRLGNAWMTILRELNAIKQNESIRNYFYNNFYKIANLDPEEISLPMQISSLMNKAMHAGYIKKLIDSWTVNKKLDFMRASIIPCQFKS